MLTPQEVSNRAFSKAVMGGYNMSMVDEFLDELTDDYSALYKENTALKTKMKVLVDKVEEYRQTEDSMRAALLSAQRMAAAMVHDAEAQKEEMIADAERAARAKIADLQRALHEEQLRLNTAKEETRAFVEELRALYERQLLSLDALGDLAPGEVREITAHRDFSAADIEESINAAFREADAANEAVVEVPTEEASVEPTSVSPAELAAAAAEPEPPFAAPVITPAPPFAQPVSVTPAPAFEQSVPSEGERSEEDLAATRRSPVISLNDLQFGSNYRSE
ncbi:MAG: DivIVA domain-containing protein [Oscillospiraceae bacterium]|nr:DivIVA domain-containing protein [Oscillospiraceae bacterium]